MSIISSRGNDGVVFLDQKSNFTCDKCSFYNNGYSGYI
jgi:hypothetical protein